MYLPDGLKGAPQTLNTSLLLLPSPPSWSSARLQDSVASSQYSVPQESSVKRNPTAAKNKAKKRRSFSLSAADMSVRLHARTRSFSGNKLWHHVLVSLKGYSYRSVCVCLGHTHSHKNSCYVNTFKKKQITTVEISRWHLLECRHWNPDLVQYKAIQFNWDLLGNSDGPTTVIQTHVHILIRLLFKRWFINKNRDKHQEWSADCCFFFFFKHVCLMI